jgi:hypothetical protein
MNSKIFLPFSTMAIAAVVLLFASGPIVTDQHASAAIYHYGHYYGHHYGHYYGHHYRHYHYHGHYRYHGHYGHYGY